MQEKKFLSVERLPQVHKGQLNVANSSGFWESGLGWTLDMRMCKALSVLKLHGQFEYRHEYRSLLWCINLICLRSSFLLWKHTLHSLHLHMTLEYGLARPIWIHHGFPLTCHPYLSVHSVLSLADDHLFQGTFAGEGGSWGGWPKFHLEFLWWPEREREHLRVRDTSKCGA